MQRPYFSRLQSFGYDDVVYASSYQWEHLGTVLGIPVCQRFSFWANLRISDRAVSYFSYQLSVGASCSRAWYSRLPALFILGKSTGRR